MIENTQFKERVILVGVVTENQEEVLNSLEELEDLADTAGAITVGVVIQNRERIHPGTYVGTGKLEEIQQLIWEKDATGIICDDELSPSQMGNLQDKLEIKVMDRTMVILDIFAQRASTSEGKLQVELAQLKYQSSRLSGYGKTMSRLGGGIGTRGPGEKKLEIDRRLIKSRIGRLREDLEEVRRHREITRTERQKNRISVAAIVGYTNAGKSTLLNRLTDAGVLEEDQVFATLDPTTRAVALPGGQQILLTDTVGFIRKLPHHLIDAFRSTLEEACYADVIVHVVDASNPHAEEQMLIVYETLRNLGVENKPVVTLLNKQDRLREIVMGDATGEENPVWDSDGNMDGDSAESMRWVSGGDSAESLNGVRGGNTAGFSFSIQQIRDFMAEAVIPVSARSGEGLDEFLETVESILRRSKLYLEKVIDYKNAGVLQQIRDQGELLHEEYLDDGIMIKAYVPESLFRKINGC